MGRWPTRSPRTHSTRARLARSRGPPPFSLTGTARLGSPRRGRYVTRFRVPPHRTGRRAPGARRRWSPPARAHCPRADVPFMSAGPGRSARAGAACDGRAVEPCRIRLEPLDLARSYVGRVRRETVTYCGSTFLLAVFGSTSTTILGSEREATETFSRRHSAPRQKRKGTVQLQGPPRLASRARQILLFFHRSSLFAADRRLRPWFRCLPARHVRGDTPSASLTTQHAEARFGCLVG